MLFHPSVQVKIPERFIFISILALEILSFSSHIKLLFASLKFCSYVNGKFRVGISQEP